MNIGSLLGPARLGYQLARKRSRYNDYWTRSADRLWRELDLPGGPDRFEKSVKQAVRQTNNASRRQRLQSALMGGQTFAHFQTVAKDVGAALPRVLREDYPHDELPGDEEIARRFERAVRAAVAASANDEVAERILEAKGEPAQSTRLKWSLRTAVVGAAAVGALVSRIMENHGSSDSAAVVAGLVVAASLGTVGVAALSGRAASSIQTAYDALEQFVDRLFRFNVPDRGDSPTRDIYDTPRVSQRVAAELERLVEIGRGKGPPSACETIYRYDGEEVARLLKSEADLERSLRSLRPSRDWHAPSCIQQRMPEVFGSMTTVAMDDWQAELEYGAAVLDLLVCCAALATDLEHAMDAAADKAA